MIELVAFGEVNPDIVVTGVGELAFGQSEDIIGVTTMTIGSSVAIMASGAARLGVAVGLVGVIGDDGFGAFMLERLAERGVDTSLVRTITGGRTGSSVILVRADDANDRHILTDFGVMGDLLATDVALDQLPDLRHLHIGSWFLQTGAVAALPQLLKAVRAQGITTSVDPNDDPVREWDLGLPAALVDVDILFCNEPEALGLARSEAGRLDAARQLLARMPTDSPSVVVLKCGAEGAYALTREGAWHVQAPVMDVVDTVGAGDSLTAGFLAARLSGEPIGEALRLGVAAGSLSTQASGGTTAQPELGAALELARTLKVTHEPVLPH
ncbi:MAG: carbohydrate kinase family protein [Actinomycetes bacterium]